MKKTKRISISALCVALAFVLSYFESLIPLNFGVPGIKLGLANIVVLTALYLLPKSDAFVISFIRILLSGLLFSGAFSLAYSFAGGLLSFCVMLLLKNSKKISMLGVSVLGAVSHNVAQIIVAIIIMESKSIAYYLPVLLISATVSGVVVGILSAVVFSRFYKKNNCDK